MNTKTWIIFGAVCIALFGGLIAYSRSQQTTIDTASIDANSIIAASAENGKIADHVEGNATSPVRLIEYGDFQCPSCSAAHPGIKKIMEDYGDKIAFVFRNFPLTSIHPNAFAAATAAESAGLQGKYWEMHNILFENQNEWSSLSPEQRTGRFITLAQQAGVTNVDTFKADLSSKRVADKIKFDQALGKSQNVTGTPAFFLDGEKINTDISGKLVQGDTKALRDLINTKLKEKNIEVPVNS